MQWWPDCTWRCCKLPVVCSIILASTIHDLLIAAASFHTTLSDEWKHWVSRSDQHFQLAMQAASSVASTCPTFSMWPRCCPPFKPDWWIVRWWWQSCLFNWFICDKHAQQIASGVFSHMDGHTFFLSQSNNPGKGGFRCGFYKKCFCLPWNLVVLKFTCIAVNLSKEDNARTNFILVLEMFLNFFRMCHIQRSTWTAAACAFDPRGRKNLFDFEEENDNNKEAKITSVIFVWDTKLNNAWNTSPNEEPKNHCSWTCHFKWCCFSQAKDKILKTKFLAQFSGLLSWWNRCNDFRTLLSFVSTWQHVMGWSEMKSNICQDKMLHGCWTLWQHCVVTKSHMLLLLTNPFRVQKREGKQSLLVVVLCVLERTWQIEPRHFRKFTTFYVCVQNYFR